MTKVPGLIFGCLKVVVSVPISAVRGFFQARFDGFMNSDETCRKIPEDYGTDPNASDCGDSPFK